MNKSIAKVYGGSRLYGLDNEKSDIDFKGIFIPDMKGLLSTNSFNFSIASLTAFMRLLKM